MQMHPYVSFQGNCEAAFQFYVEALGAKLGPLFRYAGSPLADQAPAGWQEKIMHGSVTVGGQTLMGADVAPQSYERPQGFSLSLQIKGAAEAERIYQALAQGGRIMLPLAETFWAVRFGMVVDRFGVPWLINAEE